MTRDRAPNNHALGPLPFRTTDLDSLLFPGHPGAGDG